MNYGVRVEPGETDARFRQRGCFTVSSRLSVASYPELEDLEVKSSCSREVVMLQVFKNSVGSSKGVSPASCEWASWTSWSDLS